MLRQAVFLHTQRMVLFAEEAQCKTHSSYIACPGECGSLTTGSRFMLRRLQCLITAAWKNKNETG